MQEKKKSLSLIQLSSQKMVLPLFFFFDLNLLLFFFKKEISFELAVNKTCSCKLTFKSPEEKKEWMTDVLQSIGDLLEKEALIKAQLQKKSKTQENKERSNSF